MRKLGFILGALLISVSTVSYAANVANNSASAIANPPQGNQTQGTVVNIDANGNLIVLDEKGDVYIITNAGLNLTVAIGDEVKVIVIITPNGKRIINIVGA